MNTNTIIKFTIFIKILCIIVSIGVFTYIYVNTEKKGSIYGFYNLHYNPYHNLHYNLHYNSYDDYNFITDYDIYNTQEYLFLNELLYGFSLPTRNPNSKRWNNSTITYYVDLPDKLLKLSRCPYFNYYQYLNMETLIDKHNMINLIDRAISEWTNHININIIRTPFENNCDFIIKAHAYNNNDDGYIDNFQKKLILVINTNICCHSLERLYYVIIHELGHVLGLENNYEPDSIMYYNRQRTFNRPAQYDIENAIKLYGRKNNNKIITNNQFNSQSSNKSTKENKKKKTMKYK